MHTQIKSISQSMVDPGTKIQATDFGATTNTDGPTVRLYNVIVLVMSITSHVVDCYGTVVVFTQGCSPALTGRYFSYELSFSEEFPW